jgi:uncharacterized protein YbcI
MVVNSTSRESLELEVANAAARYHREQQGRAPGRIHVVISGDLIVIVTNDVYTHNEQQLATTEEGRKMIRDARRELRSLTRDRAHDEVARVCGCPVVRSYWDFDIRVGEQLEAYVLSESLDKRFLL